MRDNANISSLTLSALFTARLADNHPVAEGLQLSATSQMTLFTRPRTSLTLFNRIHLMLSTANIGQQNLITNLKLHSFK